jgi:phenylacetate-coenzyme A ligase PaaK-like adenylate-forming protein
MRYDDILKIPPYSLNSQDKHNMLTRILIGLTSHHYENCVQYRRILDGLRVNAEAISSYLDVPFLPVALFKEMDLLSVARADIVKTMTSSGTTGQALSNIFLDKTTASNQQKTLVKIVNDFIGASRLPMLIIDCPSVTKDRKMFSARGAGILGFSIFGSDRVYALNDDMSLNVEALEDFLEKYSGSVILMFGFTFMVWKHFYMELSRLGLKLDISQGVLIHGGGWKKLSSEKVSPERFARGLFDVCGIRRIHDYYGMVEQTGCIYMQCECGYLHASIYSDIVIRNYLDFSVCDFGQRGIVQTFSIIPESYPGHSLLTEDEGVLLGEDDCSCGRMGKYFKIIGRLKNAETRGCSDTYAEGF